MGTKAAENWIRDGLLRGLELSWVQGILDLSAEIQPLIPEAIAGQVLDPGYSFMGEVADHLSGLAGIARTAPVPLDHLRRYLVKERLPVVLKLQGEQVDAFLSMATDVTQTAMIEGWARGKYVAEIERLADLFGAKGFQSPYASTWYHDWVLTGAYNSAQLEMLLNTSAGSLFPFVRIRTKRDERVRPAHREVDNLTARPTWSGWTRWTPPLGHGCRCLLEKIGWKAARAMGLAERIPWGSAVVIR